MLAASDITPTTIAVIKGPVIVAKTMIFQSAGCCIVNAHRYLLGGEDQGFAIVAGLSISFIPDVSQGGMACQHVLFASKGQIVQVQ
jgi:hypothetical protein